MDQGHFMQRAIELAKQGWPWAEPNPLVGCVIVHNNKIVAEGYHREFGKAHAEVNAINSLPENINPSECTLYVTLEPCSHFGKTPPCSDLIIQKGFKIVVIANTDPNPLVAGGGIKKLKDAGIEVIQGILENEAALLNKRFFTFHQKHRPYIILKWAQTADGFISRWPVPARREDNLISTPEQFAAGHRLRATVMAIMVGKNTVLCDDPALTTRLAEGPNPIRIFIDKNLEVPLHFKIYNNEAPTLVFNAQKNEVKGNISWVRIDFTGNVLQQICTKLYEMHIQSVLVEGGPHLLNDFIQQNLYDETVVFVNKDLKFGEGILAPKTIK